MAPLNPNNTDRIKIFYQNAIAEHVVLVRAVSSGDIADVKDNFLAIVGYLSSLFHFHEITALQRAAEGSDLFFDIDGTDFVGETWGTGPASAESNPVAATFVGRSGEGRRSKFSLFGYNGGVSAYRVTSAENTGVENAVATLNGSETSFVAIDGLPVIWKAYADIKANDYWVAQSRG